MCIRDSPKGDVLTLIKPRQHSLFWADGEARRGTFHTNFTLNPDANNWIGLYDSGRNLLAQVVIPAGSLQTNQSYARVSDAAEKWEVKDGSAEKYVTPSTNNKTIDSNAKICLLYTSLLHAGVPNPQTKISTPAGKYQSEHNLAPDEL